MYKSDCKSLRNFNFKKNKKRKDINDRWFKELNDLAVLNYVPHYEVFTDLHLHHKFYETTWLILRHSLPVKQRLFDRGHPDVEDPYCPHHSSTIGNGQKETISHALFCSTVRPVWSWFFYTVSRMNGRETETYFKGHNLLRNTDAYMMTKFLCKLVRDDHYDPEGVTVSESIRGLLLIVTYCIIRQRNRLSIDELRLPEARDRAKHARNIIEDTCARFRGVIVKKFRERTEGLERSTAAEVKKATAKVKEFQSVYLRNKHWGEIPDISSNKPKLELSLFHEVFKPVDWPEKVLIFLPGRVRRPSSVISAAGRHPQGNTTQRVIDTG